MNSIIEDWKTQLVTLTPSERAEQADFLLASLEPDPDGVEAAWDVEASRRVSAIRSGTATGRPPGRRVLGRVARAPTLKAFAIPIEPDAKVQTVLKPPRRSTPMAMSVCHICGHCGHRVSAWDEGNPYYIDEAGQKQYAYHPNHDLLDRCVGNDSPHLCLACGEEFLMDSRAPIEQCPGCGSSEIEDAYRLEGRRCPACKSGTFALDPNASCIS